MSAASLVKNQIDDSTRLNRCDEEGNLVVVMGAGGTGALEATQLLSANSALNTSVSAGLLVDLATQAFTPTAGSGAGVVTAANTDYTALAANIARKSLLIQNTSASASITINPLGAAAYAAGLVGLTLSAGATLILDVKVPNAAIHVASATAGATYFIVEG